MADVAARHSRPKEEPVDFHYTPEQDTFRRDIRQWLAANLPKDLCVDDPQDERVAPDRATFERRVEWQRTMYKAGWVGAVVNAVLRKAAAEHATVAFPDPRDEPVKALAAIWAFPEWLVKRWIDRYGPEPTAALCESINSPPLTLRAARSRPAGK
jgi:16S rRNA (cytosine967-C5)-methyltransferase